MTTHGSYPLYPNLPSFPLQISVNGSWRMSYGCDGRSEPGCPILTLHVPTKSDVIVFFDTVTRVAEAGM